MTVSVVGSGSNLLVADEGVRGPRAQARPRARGDLASTAGACSAAAARGCRRSRPGGPRGAVGDRVRREHPRHGRRRGADERQRLRRRARSGARVGADRDRRGLRAPRAAGARLRLPPLEPRDGRDRGARRPAARRGGRRDAVKATLEEMRRRRHEAQPQGIKTFGSTFKNPDDPRAGGAQRRAAARRRPAATAWRSAARASRPSTRTSSRTPARPPPRRCSR